MAFNIRDMMGAMNASGGLTKTSKFFAEVYPPRSLAVNPNLFFLCEAAALPGVSFQTDEIRMTGYGNVEKRPYAPIFTDITLHFYNDSNSKVLNFYHRWMQAIYNFNATINPEATTRSGLAINTLGYPNEYHGIVEITHFDDASEQVIKYTLIDAYPIAISDVAVDWNNQDQLVRIPITFAYNYWNSETLDQGTINYKSQAIYNATQATASRVDAENKVIWELLNFTSPAIVQNKVNILAGVLSFL